KAITVTQQVSDQLVSGATAANRSAGQLEQVVDELQHVVGGRAQPSAIPPQTSSSPNSRAPEPAGAMAARPANDQMMRAPQAPVHFGQMGSMDNMGQMGRGGPPSQMGRGGPPSQMGGPPSRRNPGSRTFRNSPSQYGPPDGFSGYPPAGRPSRALPDDQWGAPANTNWDDH
ncbi:MAG TPA: hypothetical protein VFU63_00435, partial [Ktedonobacterales bacterium]|nr:hypothetical protein [Ktedonobacterales bacterium]